jgi:hypothetical protein
MSLREVVKFWKARPVKALGAALALMVALFLLVSCDQEKPPVLTPTADIPTAEATVDAVAEQTSAVIESVDEPTAIPTQVPPTATPEPMAASVNGIPILLADFQKEADRYQQAQEELGLIAEGESGDYTDVVLKALIETAIIAQAAESEGIVVTDQMVTDRIVELKEASGGDANFTSWLAANQWTEFEAALILSH